MVLRFQNIKPKEELYEPHCDCLDPPKTNSNYSLRKVEPSNCPGNVRTFDIYPSPNRPGHKSKEDKALPVEPVTNEQENPNIFFFRVKRKCKNGSQNYNMGLELRSPRPWRKKDWLK